MSATGMTIPLAEAQRVAAAVLADLTSYCERIEVAGSVDGRLVTASGQMVPTPEEVDVFRACHVKYIPPEQRSGRLVF